MKEYFGDSFYFNYLGLGTFIIVQNHNLSPNKKDWSEFIKCADKENITSMIVYSTGPHPNASQRKELGEVFDRVKVKTGNQPHFACICPLFAPKIVTRVISLVIRSKVLTCDPKDWSDAFDYVKIPETLRGEALRYINFGADKFNLPHIGF